jgi:hypothetical protein
MPNRSTLPHFAPPRSYLAPQQRARQLSTDILPRMWISSGYNEEKEKWAIENTSFLEEYF